MAISIQTNLNSLFTQRALISAQSGVHTSVNRLSSGLRINSAKDDAAGLAISSRMTSQVRSSVPLMRGINDGVSLLQVAGGGIRSILDVMQRMREMTVQAANGTLTGSDREALNAEYQELLKQVDSVADKTEAFGIFPLKGDPVTVAAPVPTKDYTALENSNVPHITDNFPTSGLPEKWFSSGIAPVAYIPQGATDVSMEIYDNGADDDLQIFTTDGKHIVGTPISDDTWNTNTNDVFNSADMKNKVFKAENGFSSGAVYDATQLLDGSQKFAADINSAGALSGNFNGMQIKYSGDGHDQTGDLKEYLHIDKTTEPLIVVVSGSGAFSAKASWGTMPDKSEGPVPKSERVPPVAIRPLPGLQILTSATPGMALTFVTIEKTPSDTKTLGLVGSALNPLDEVIKSMNALDAAINKVSGYAATHGAIEVRLENAVANAQISAENTSAARGRIMDADFAIESAQLSAQMIRSSASTAMLAQGNLNAKMVLSLLSS